MAKLHESRKPILWALASKRNDSHVACREDGTVLRRHVLSDGSCLGWHVLGHLKFETPAEALERLLTKSGYVAMEVPAK